MNQSSPFSFFLIYIHTVLNKTNFNISLPLCTITADGLLNGREGGWLGAYGHGRLANKGVAGESWTCIH